MSNIIIVLTSHHTFESGGVGTHLSVMNQALLQAEGESHFILGNSLKNRIIFKIFSKGLNFFKLQSAELLLRGILLNKEIRKIDFTESTNLNFICHDKYSTLAAIIYRKKNTSQMIKITQVLHAPFSEQFLISHPTDSTFFSIAKVIERGLAEQIDKFIGVDQLQIDLERNFNKYTAIENFKVIPNAVDISKLDKISFTKINSNLGYIVIARHLQKKNGVKYGIDGALKFINYNKLGVSRVVVVGDGPDMSDLKKLYSHEIKIGKLILKGRLTNLETLSLIKNAYASLVPSVPVGNYIEATSLTMLESMYLQTPIIASNIGGLADTITSGVNGFLVEHSNSNEIFNQLSSLKDVDLVSINENAKAEIIKNYSIDIWWRRIYQFIIN